jgi:hypothetical protein
VKITMAALVLRSKLLSDGGTEILIDHSWLCTTDQPGRKSEECIQPDPTRLLRKDGLRIAIAAIDGYKEVSRWHDKRQQAAC